MKNFNEYCFKLKLKVNNSNKQSAVNSQIKNLRHIVKKKNVLKEYENCNFNEFQETCSFCDYSDFIKYEEWLTK